LRNPIVTTSLDKPILYQDLIYKQFDTGHRISIRVISNGQSFPLMGYEAFAFFQLPEKPLEQRNCNIENNTIIIELDGYLLSEVGKIPFEVEIHKDGEITTTYRMEYTVEESFDTDNAITSQPTWDIFNQFLELDITQFVKTSDMPTKLSQFENDLGIGGGTGGLLYPTFEINMETGMLEVSNNENLAFGINEEGYLEVTI
jgi:hypothetical protein